MSWVGSKSMHLFDSFLCVQFEDGGLMLTRHSLYASRQRWLQSDLKPLVLVRHDTKRTLELLVFLRVAPVELLLEGDAAFGVVVTTGMLFTLSFAFPYFWWCSYFPRERDRGVGTTLLSWASHASPASQELAYSSEKSFQGRPHLNHPLCHLPQPPQL